MLDAMAEIRDLASCGQVQTKSKLCEPLGAGIVERLLHGLALDTDPRCTYVHSFTISAASPAIGVESPSRMSLDVHHVDLGTIATALWSTQLATTRMPHPLSLFMIIVLHVDVLFRCVLLSFDPYSLALNCTLGSHSS